MYATGEKISIIVVAGTDNGLMGSLAVVGNEAKSEVRTVMVSRNGHRAYLELGPSEKNVHFVAKMIGYNLDGHLV